MPFRYIWESFANKKLLSVSKGKRQKKRRRLAQDYARPRVRHSTGRWSSPIPEIFYLNVCFPAGLKSRAGAYVLVVLPKALELMVICIPPPIRWPPQGGQLSSTKSQWTKLSTGGEDLGPPPVLPLTQLGISEQWKLSGTSNFLEHGLAPVIIISDLFCTLELQSVAANTYDPIWSAQQRGKERKRKQILFEITQGDRS